MESVIFRKPGSLSHHPSNSLACTGKSHDPLSAPAHSLFSRVSPLLHAHEIRRARPAQVICWTWPTHDQLLHLPKLWWGLPHRACDCIQHSKDWLFSGVFPSCASHVLQPQITKAASIVQLPQKSLQHFFSPRVQLGFIQQERAEVAMCALHATHSGRQIPCNPARDDLNCWIIDLKAWTEIWGGRSHAILSRIPLSRLPLACFFASQIAWTHTHAQGTPACSRGQGKTSEDLCYSSSDTEYVAGSSKTAIRWIPPAQCGRALARYSSATSSWLHDFLKWLFAPYLWDPVPTWSNFTQAGGQWGKKIHDMKTNHETHKRQRASSRPLWPGHSTQSLTSTVVLSVHAEGRFCCPYSSNSSRQQWDLFSG